MIKGLHTLNTDAKILDMCELLPPSKVIYVDVIITLPIAIVDGDGLPNS